MPKSARTFVIKVDPSVQLSDKARKELAATMSGSTAASLARLDLKGTVAFIPRIQWPGGIIIDLEKIVPAGTLKGLGGR
jgi:hypothetical protein